MSVPQKVLAFMGVLLAALIVGGVVAWFAVGPSSPPVREDSPVRTEAKTSPPPKLATVDTNRQPAVTNRGRLPPRRRPSNQVSATGAPVADTNTWENKIDTVLTSDADDSQKANRILELLPQLPAEGQEEAAEHLANLLPDEQYSSARQLLTKTNTSSAVLDVLMSDLLNRPNEIKLPTLLDVARAPDHPNAEEAKEFLELYLENDFGTDWGKWEDAMKTWLKENPD